MQVSKNNYIFFRKVHCSSFTLSNTLILPWQARIVLPWHQGVHGPRLVPALQSCWLISIRWLQQVSEVLLNFKYIHISLAKGLAHSLEVSNFRWLWNTSKIFSKKSRAVTERKVLRCVEHYWAEERLCFHIANSMPQYGKYFILE